ncbi:uncharacterized protein PV09_02743 [Verruconis gallopava]|uniref:Rhodopsin domain-containing protein n=1 Tax=Verruconis gallopava TaxID=253628 RepID=A0A0D1XU17_9PEZI|nr:uncharacterized protein PV09_02743 [Verruconis gallopava]KIW06271.1 hypothetical protein PV09_02743 [Verruconis gallopava]
MLDMMHEKRQLGGVLGAAHSTSTIVVNAVFLGLAWFAVLLRVYTRVRLVRVFYMEDWLMVLSCMFFTVYCAAVIRQSQVVAVGAGKLLTINQTMDATELLIISETFYIWCVLVLKLSVGLFYLRLSVERWQKLVVYFLMAISTSFSIGLFFFEVFQCGYFTSMLEFVLKKAADECVSGYTIEAMTYTHAAITAFTDWVFVILPFFILKSSKMQTKEKIVVGSLMAFASVSGIAAVIRFKYVPGIAVTQETFFSSVTDIAIWSCIEPGIGITAGSFICLRPLFRKPLQAASRAIGYMSSGSQKRNGYVHELTSTSTSHLREPVAYQKRDSRDLETAFDADNTPPNWPFPATTASNDMNHSERQLRQVLDTRQVRRKSSLGFPIGGYSSNKTTPDRIREAWIDDSDSR